MTEAAEEEKKQEEARFTPSKQQIIDMYRRLNQEVKQIQEKVFDLQNKAEEHELVAKTIEPLPGERKCCRLISGVLVERTVAQVLPTLHEHADALRKAVKSHEDLLQRKQKELAEFMSVYKIQVKGSTDEEMQAAESQGLLVS